MKSLIPICVLVLWIGRASADDKSTKTFVDPLTTHDPHLYLLADDHWIAQQSGLRRVTNQARPLAEPIVWPDDPRTETDCAWGNVIREPDGRFRLWYTTMMMGHNGAGPHEMAKAGVWGQGETFEFRPRSPRDVREVETMLGKYAESMDGIHWTKPELNLIEFRGSRKNNIVLTGELAAKQTDGALTNFDGLTVLRDDQEPDLHKRYKLIAHWESVHCWDNHDASGQLGRPQKKHEWYWSARGEYVTYSADGLRWEQPLTKVPFPSGGGDRMLVVPDHRHERWMAYTRAGGWAYPAFSYSPNLLEWSAPEPAAHITPASVQAPAVECMIPFNYGNQDLGFPVGMDKPRGLFRTLLAARHDGGDWHWVNDTEPCIPAGEPSTYNATGCVPLHNEPFVVGDELLLFFNAFSRNQATPCPFGTRTIGVAKLRRDGFAGLTADQSDKPGTLTTNAISIPTKNLQINVEVRGSGGRVETAVLDERGHEISGYGFADSQSIETDGVRSAVRFAQHEDLSELVGKRVQLAFRVRGEAILYAFCFSRDS